jgi:hypothetical protein
MEVCSRPNNALNDAGQKERLMVVYLGAAAGESRSHP